MSSIFPFFFVFSRNWTVFVIFWWYLAVSENFFFFQNQEKKWRFVLGSPPNPEPEDFFGLSFWKLRFRFKTRMNRARDLVYQRFSVESALM